MSSVLTELPASIAAGTTVAYTKTFADYPADDGWTLTLHLAGVDVAAVVAAADGQAFVVTILPEHTAHPFRAGVYSWAERVVKSGEVREVASGKVTILRDLSTAAPGDEQSYLERSISLLKAHIENRLPAGMHAYAIAGRSVSKIPIGEALELLATMEARLARLADPTAVGRRVLVSFPPTGYDR